MKLYISQSDIDAGEPCMASKCALSLAFTRATGLECRSGGDSMWVPKLEAMGRMSQVGSRFICLFDMDRKLCVPTVVEVYFKEDAPADLHRDYVPSTDLADKVTKKVIPGKGAHSQTVYAH